MMLGKYSFGIGDRFGPQGRAQLAALQKAKEAGVDVTPVWNKSHREHSIIGTEPADVRREADAAVAACGWAGPYFVDADHIGLRNVDHFIEASDFFTLDVADWIGQPAAQAEVDAFLSRHASLIGTLEIDGLPKALRIAVSYTHLRAHETVLDLVCRLLLEKKNTTHSNPGCNLLLR
mgnify:CR=1 FL=1